MRVLISGASGLIGTALTEHLRATGHDVTRLVRRPAGPGEITWDPPRGVLPGAAIEGADAVVNLGGVGIGDKRWTDDYKRELRDSRVVGTRLLAETIAASAKRPAVLLSGSAIGWYGARGDEELAEDAAPGTGFLADLCREWEAATAPAESAGARVVHLRTGIVLSTKGGALRKQLPLFKAGLGGRFGAGRQWQSWISIDDELGAITHLLTAPVQGAVNLTAPMPVTNRECTKVLASVLKRPAFATIPMFGPSLLLGRELAENLLYTGQRVVPRVLLSSGYSFRHPTLEGALRSLLQR